MITMDRLPILQFPCALEDVLLPIGCCDGTAEADRYDEETEAYLYC